jgi:predicted phage-related endonuclease
MKTVELEIGSPEWQAAYTASKAPTMMGVDKHTSRSELVRQMATGIRKEIDALTQVRFDRGHEIEVIARTFAEEHLDLGFEDHLSPVTYSGEFDGITLFASLDGQFLPNNWECKSLNDELRESLARGVIPDRYHPQMEQGLMVSGAESCLFTASDGTRDGTLHAWYASNPVLRKRIIAGWKQFAEDVANYQHVEVIPAAVATPIRDFPAIVYDVKGMSLTSNIIDVVKPYALAEVAKYEKKPETDQEFADLDAFTKKARLFTKKSVLLRETVMAGLVDFDQFFRDMAEVEEILTKAAISGEKKFKTEKENRKVALIEETRNAFSEYLSALCLRIGGKWIPSPAVNYWSEAVKGLSAVSSMQNELSTALANAKIDANEIAARIVENRNSLTGEAHDWMFLFPDFGSVCAKAEDDFSALLSMRVGNHKAAEDKRIEAEREKIRAEERAKAEAEAKAKAQAEADRIRAEEKAKADSEYAEALRLSAEQEKARVARELEKNKESRQQLDSANMADALQHGFGPVKAIDANEPPMKLGEISSRLGFAVTADFLAQLGIHPIATERSAKLYAASSFPAICNALIVHIQSASRDWRMAA